MRLVRPFTVVDAAYVSSDVLENDAGVYNAGSTYALNQEVILTTGVHRRYRSLQAGNIGHTPNDPANTAWWLDLGPTNRWALFDGAIGTYTTKATSFTYTIQCTGRIDTLAFLDVQATSIQVQVYDGVTLVYDQTYNMLSNSGITDWYAYYTEEIVRKSDKTVLDLPAYLNPKIVFTVTNVGATASVGCVIPGRQRYIGRTQYGSSVGINDFSKKEKDQFGVYQVVERPFSKRGSFNIMVDNNFIDELQTLLAGYRATPILYLGTDVYESSSIYGFYKDFTLVIEHFNETQCNLEIEGLT